MGVTSMVKTLLTSRPLKGALCPNLNLPPTLICSTYQTHAKESPAKILLNIKKKSTNVPNKNLFQLPWSVCPKCSSNPSVSNPSSNNIWFKVCISKQMVKICSKVNKSEIKEPKPIKVQRKKLEYVCEEASTHLAQQLEHRAKSGEVMTMEVMTSMAAFSKFEYEPVICQRQI